MVSARWILLSLWIPATAHADLVAARETRCAIAVTMNGPIATVTETHDLLGLDEQPTEAAYHVALPIDAAITGATVQSGKHASTALTIPSEALSATTPDADRLGLVPDRGLVRWSGDDSDQQHIESWPRRRRGSR
jgi:hypothetical protein